jgi:hypothetical protein
MSFYRYLLKIYDKLTISKISKGIDYARYVIDIICLFNGLHTSTIIMVILMIAILGKYFLFLNPKLKFIDYTKI